MFTKITLLALIGAVQADSDAGCTEKYVHPDYQGTIGTEPCDDEYPCAEFLTHPCLEADFCTEDEFLGCFDTDESIAWEAEQIACVSNVTQQEWDDWAKCFEDEGLNEVYDEDFDDDFSWYGEPDDSEEDDDEEDDDEEDDDEEDEDDENLAQIMAQVEDDSQGESDNEGDSQDGDSVHTTDDGVDEDNDSFDFEEWIGLTKE